ncbi:MAG: hypothetical protein K8M05_20105 [Deltaproteobacteria bacterium]|nr:hypothetical protein [Kofleriaceae bacterium]
MKKLTTAFALTGLLSLAAAGTAAAENLSGWATRDWNNFHSSFMGDVTRNPNGSVTGHFTIITFNDGEETVYCRYLRFREIRIVNNSWQFEGWGVCLSASSGGYYPVHNRFTLIDYGVPGAGADYVDINYYGPVGPSVPGGFIQTGELTAIP